MSEEAREELSPEEAKAYRKQLEEEFDNDDFGTVDDTLTEELDPGPKEKDPGEGGGGDLGEDPWEGVNPALKAEFDRMSEKAAKVDEFATRLQQAESRIGAVTNQLTEAQKAAEEANQKPTEEQIAAAAASKEKWEELKADFPEWGEAIEGQFAALREELGANGGGITQADLDAAIQKASEEVDLKVELGILNYAYPNWEEIKDSNDFKTWVKAQPEDLIAKTRSTSAYDAIDVLDLYTEARGTKKTASEINRDRQQRLRTSVRPGGKKGKPPKSEQDMTDAEYRSKVGAEIFAED